MGDAYDVLFAASIIGNLDIIKEIFERYKNIDVNVSNDSDIAALHNAVAYNHIDVAEYLISKGAWINITDKNGKTPLHIATEIDEPEIAAFLLAHGAKVDVRDTDGWTPLHMAVIHKFYDMAKLLIRYHSKINVEDSNGYTPLDYAKDEQMISILTRGKRTSLGNKLPVDVIFEGKEQEDKNGKRFYTTSF